MGWQHPLPTSIKVVMPILPRYYTIGMDNICIRVDTIIPQTSYILGTESTYTKVAIPILPKYSTPGMVNISIKGAILIRQKLFIPLTGNIFIKESIPIHPIYSSLGTESTYTPDLRPIPPIFNIL